MNIRVTRVTAGNWILGLLAMAFSGYAVAQVTIEPSQIQLNNLSFDQLQQAAQAGDPDAQYALGYMYYYGKGAPQNTHTALNWLKRAAVQGQQQAVKAMALLGPAEPSVPAAVPLEPTTTTTETVVANEGLAKSAKEVKPVAAGAFTIQLLSSSSKAAAESYIKANHLADKAKIYSTRKKSKVWYVVGYGNYSSSAEAKSMMKKLPAAIRAKKPFVKSTDNLSS